MYILTNYVYILLLILLLILILLFIVIIYIYTLVYLLYRHRNRLIIILYIYICLCLCLQPCLSSMGLASAARWRSLSSLPGIAWKRCRDIFCDGITGIHYIYIYGYMGNGIYGILYIQLSGNTLEQMDIYIYMGYIGFMEMRIFVRYEWD